MLTKEFVQSLLDQCGDLRNHINDRILEIASICRKHFKFGEWKPGYDDESKVYFDFCSLDINNKNEETIYIDCLPRFYECIDNEKEEERINFIDKFGVHYELTNQIPIRWLWEDFEQELLDGVKLYKNKDANLLNELISKKEIYESVKLKLTEDEVKLLDINASISSLDRAINRCR